MAQSLKKNILLLTVRSDTGGGPKHVSELLESLNSSCDHNLFVAAPTFGKYSPFFIKWSSAFLSIPFRRFNLITLFEIYLFCRRHSISIVHSHGFGAGIYSRALKLFGLKVIHTYHGVHQSISWKAALKNKIEKTFSNLSDKVIFVSESEKNLASKLQIATPKKSLIINNGINFKALRQTINQSRQIDLSLFGEDSNNIILGTLSRLDAHKGNHLLIYFLSKLPKKYKLIIAGGGPEENNLRNLIDELQLKNRVLLLGETPSPHPLLKSLDIYLSASKGEGLPYSILEAKGANLPLLISRVPGHIGLIDDQYLFNLNNENEFLQKIEKLSNETVVINHHWEKLYDLKEGHLKLESLYESLY